jgi:hypothetical protein
MKHFYKNWLSSVGGLDVFITITLKQALRNQEGALVWITPEEIQKTAKVLRNHITRKTIGRRKITPFIVFREGGTDEKRFHLHILTAIPEWMSFEDFSNLIRFKADRLDWVYNEIDIRPIKKGTHHSVVSYTFKEGSDAFLPEASSLP